MRSLPPKLLISDAFVLMDFVEVVPTVLQAVVRSVGSMHVTTAVLSKVGQLDKGAVEALGLQVVDPPFSAFAAAVSKGGLLCLSDHLCILVAKSEGWACVSDDPPLRTACRNEGLGVLWGLEMMAFAVVRGLLSDEEAQRAAQKLRRANPRITEDIALRCSTKYKRR